MGDGFKVKMTLWVLFCMSIVNGGSRLFRNFEKVLEDVLGFCGREYFVLLVMFVCDKEGGERRVA